MKKEIKFRFVGNPENYDWDIPPVRDKVYAGDFRWTSGNQTGAPLEEWAQRKELPSNKDWIEIKE